MQLKKAWILVKKVMAYGEDYGEDNTALYLHIVLNMIRNATKCSISGA